MKHIHKYFKAKVNGVPLWACALPDCNHHMPKHYENMIPGKFTKCWGCEEPTVLDGRTMDMDKPLCENCDPNFIDITDVDLVEKLKNSGLIVDSKETE